MMMVLQFSQIHQHLALSLHLSSLWHGTISRVDSWCRPTFTQHRPDVREVGFANVVIITHRHKMVNVVNIKPAKTL